MTLEAWTAYTLYAWGSNELKPVSLMGDSQEIFGPGATIVDALDTLYIMGLTEEYDAGRLWIRDNLNFSEYVCIYNLSALVLHKQSAISFLFFF